MSHIDLFQKTAEQLFRDGVLDSDFEITDADEYKVDDLEVFIDSDGGDYWTRIDEFWYMFDPMTGKVSSSGIEWNEIVNNYGPLFLLGDC